MEYIKLVLLTGALLGISSLLFLLIKNQRDFERERWERVFDKKFKRKEGRT